MKENDLKMSAHVRIKCAIMLSYEELRTIMDILKEASNR